MKPKQSSIHFIFSILLIALAAVSACAPRPGSGELAATASSDELVVDLPAIIIDFDSDGNASISGLPVDAFAPALSDQLSLTAQQIQQLTALNVQHIQINHSGHSLVLLINGLAMPSARWDDESLANILTPLTLLDIDQVPSNIADLLPLIQQLGLSVVVRFPQQDGAQRYPLYADSAKGQDEPNSAATMDQQAQDQFLASVERAPTINIPVVYTKDGSWSVNNRTEDEYMTLLPTVPWNALHLSSAALEALQANSISQMQIATNRAGISVSFNDEILPYISWSEGELQNLLVLVEQMGLLEQNGITITPKQRELISQQLLPMIQSSNTNLMISFPK